MFVHSDSSYGNAKKSMGDRRIGQRMGRVGQVESEQNDGINDSISCPFRHGRDDVDGGGSLRDDSNYEYVIWIGANDDSDATLEPLSYCTIE